MNSDTTVVVKKPNIKVKLVLGLGGLVALVVLSFLFRFEAGVVTLVIGLGLGVRIWTQAIHHTKLAKYEQRRIEAETRKVEAEAIHARASSYFIETNTGVFVLYGVEIASFYPAVTASKTLADVPMLGSGESVVKYRRLLDVEFVHMLIVGPTNVGKTTVANWLIDTASPETVCYAIDAHSKFSRWPNRVSSVIGKGRDYQAIDKTLISLIAEMDRRYNGSELSFQPILIVVDEWLSVLEQCSNAGRFFDTIGSEARKVNMHLIITTISATADDLKCSAAVRDNLVQLTLNRSLKEQNLGELKWSRGNTELVELPGRYVERYTLPAPMVEELPILDDGPTAYAPSADELKIYELYLQEKSLRKISQEVFGSIGGNQVNQVKEILKKFNINEGV